MWLFPVDLDSLVEEKALLVHEELYHIDYRLLYDSDTGLFDGNILDHFIEFHRKPQTKKFGELSQIGECIDSNVP